MKKGTKEILFNGKPLSIIMEPINASIPGPPEGTEPCWKLIIDPEIVLIVKPYINCTYLFKLFENDQDEYIKHINLNYRIMEIFENAPPIEIMQGNKCLDVSTPYKDWVCFFDEIYSDYVGVFKLPNRIPRKDFPCGYLRGDNFVIHIPIEYPFQNDIAEAKVFLKIQSDVKQKQKDTDLQARNEKISNVVLSEQKAEKLVKPADKYIFRRNGKMWEIRYDSEESFFAEHRKGFEYIRLLLATPGKGFSLREIKDKINPPPPSKHNKNDIEKIKGKDGEMEPIISMRGTINSEDKKITPKTIAVVTKKIAEMEEEKKYPDTDRSRRDELEEEIEKCKDYLRQNTDKAGRSREFSNDTENYRVAVAKNIDNAIKSLPANLKDFVEHLSCITKGYTLKYSPASTIIWLTEDM